MITRFGSTWITQTAPRSPYVASKVGWLGGWSTFLRAWLAGFNVKPFAIDDLLRSPSGGNGLRHLEDSSAESLRQEIGNNGLRHLEDSFREASSKSIRGNSQAPVLSAAPFGYNGIRYSEDPFEEAGSDYAYVTSRGAVKPQIIVQNPHIISAARTAAWVNQSNPFGQQLYQSLHQYDLDSEGKKFIDIGTAPRADLSFAGSDANTVDLQAAIPDIFSNSNNHCYTKIILIPVAPAIKTLNKRAIGDRSLADIHELNVSFEGKKGGANREERYNRNQDKSCETLNKRLVTQESIVDLRQLPAIASKSEFGVQVLRDYCVESLEDLRLMPSLSTISLNHEESDVRTSKPIIKNVRENICPL